MRERNNVERNYVVYQAYGNNDNLNEVIYAVASLYIHKGELPVEVVIYTDSPDYLNRFLPDEIKYEILDSNIIEGWRGKIDFVHRVKIEMLIDFCSKYTGNILYLDTDTIFTAPITPLFNAIGNGILLMHTNEGRLSITSNKMFPKHIKHLCNQRFSNGSGDITITENQQMWNAGVLGFSFGKKYILQHTLELTDAMYVWFPKHTVEQFAFSYFFTREGILAAAENQIFHYWNFKEFRDVLRPFFLDNSTFAQIIANFDIISPIELIKPKMEFEKKAHLVKQILKYGLKKSWSIPDYETLKLGYAIASQDAKN